MPETKLITIIDYQMGNVHSVANAFKRIGCDVRMASTPRAVIESSYLVLPGVGAFPEAMTRLNEKGLTDAVLRAINNEIPLLGICLGMQLLCNGSDEFGETAGLGTIPDWVVEMNVSLKKPHMGWNQVYQKGDCPLLRGINGEMFYFVHSFWAPDTEAPHVVGTANYEKNFAAIVQKNYTFGVQFHPEKSSRAGLSLLENFINI